MIKRGLPREYFYKFEYDGKSFNLVCSNWNIDELTLGHIYNYSAKPKVVTRSFDYSSEELKNVLQILDDCSIYRKTTRGLHAAMLYKNGEPSALFEDISRHCAVDKLTGYINMKNIDCSDAILVVSCRLSSYIVECAAKLGIGTIITPAIAMQTALDLAKDYGIAAYFCLS